MPAAQGSVMTIQDTVGPCVSVGNNCRIDEMSSGALFLDGGNNLDVGVDVSGSGAKVTLMPGTTVTGIVGDVRIKGVVGSYADLEAEGPIVTTDLSIVEKLV